MQFKAILHYMRLVERSGDRGSRFIYLAFRSLRMWKMDLSVKAPSELGGTKTQGRYQQIPRQMRCVILVAMVNTGLEV